MNYPDAEMKLPTNAPEQNVFLTYVCTVNEVKPTQDGRKPNKLFEDPENINQEVDPTKAERAKALHELVDAHANEHVTIVENYEQNHVTQVNSEKGNPTTSNDENENSDDDDATSESNDNPHMIRLTKMKWLTEGREGSPDSRSPSLSLSPASSSSQCSRESESNLGQCTSFGDKCLSTILRLDKEYNLFGLSNIAITGSKASKKACKKDEKAVFHQTAIVQVCCRTGCRSCRYSSKTDLPASLSGCSSCSRYCYQPPSCTSCALSCVDPFICPPTVCSSCLSNYCASKLKCSPSKCFIDRKCNYGVKLTLKTKPKYEPHPGVELTPRASCILAKPQISRPCHHVPHCAAPSSCFPYLMPCYWPARAGAPCINPTRCFHNPPCPPPRKPRPSIPAEAKCPPKCGTDNTHKCLITTCRGKRTVVCECSTPQCISCFVLRPKEINGKNIAVQNKLKEDSNYKGCQSGENETLCVCQRDIQGCQDADAEPSST